MMPKDSAKIKFLLCEPVPDSPEVKPHHTWWQKTVDRVARPGVTLDIIGLKKGYFGITTYEQGYNGVEMAKRAYEAEKKGYDAFIIGCASDMGLKECRAITNIPVVAPTEASCLIAATLGERFSVIDLQGFTRPIIEGAIRNAGLISKLASIRHPEGLNAAKAAQMTFGGKQDQLIKLLTSEMARAVKEDGAEVLFISCIVTSALVNMKEIREVEGAPVIDILAATIKMAEVLLDLKKAYEIGVCRKSSYLPPSPGWDKNLPILNS
jgi:allantoin racemase